MTTDVQEDFSFAVTRPDQIFLSWCLLVTC